MLKSVFERREAGEGGDGQGGGGEALGMDERLMAEAVLRAAEILRAASRRAGARDRAQGVKMAGLMGDLEGKAFTLSLADQLFRPPSKARAADQFRYLVERHGVPSYLGVSERLALLAGVKASVFFPGVVMAGMRWQLRRETKGVILPGEEGPLQAHLRRRTQKGLRMNVNLLGEAVLGEGEAGRRLERIAAQLGSPDCDYVSVKLSAIYSQINVLDYERTLAVAKERLRVLYRAAKAGGRPYKFVNLDMEEYRDVQLTLDVFREVLMEEEFLGLSAGIVLQAYLPDSFPLLEDLTGWAMKRRRQGGKPIKVRLVKGANLAMEQVDASLHGWEQAPYGSKEEVDANFKRMLRFACSGRRLDAVRIGVASHNLFDVAYGLVLRERCADPGAVEFEMLEGMADPQAEEVRERSGSMVLYGPVVREEDFHSAIAYLVRRLDENTAPQNFLAALFGMEVGDAAWEEQRVRFESACRRVEIESGPRRTQDRGREAASVLAGRGFRNAEDTDWVLAENRRWVARFLEAEGKREVPVLQLQIGGRMVEGAESGVGWDPSRPGVESYRYALAGIGQVEDALEVAEVAGRRWGLRPLDERAALLRQCGMEIAARRGEVIATMVRDGGKAVGEADAELSEAVDFANYYADSFQGRAWNDGVRFEPLGVVVVTPPWNFPFAIPCGGILAALMAGNAVILKPAPEAVLTGELLCGILWAAGVPRDLLQFVPCPDNGIGRALVTDGRVGAVILTGAWETARMFQGWKPELNLFAETSGKNALIITAAADLDLAVKDLVKSAFGHAGQKCSAASLAIVEGALYDSPGFRAQLKDAVESLRVGGAWDRGAVVTPVVREPGEALKRALTELEEGECWLVEPREVDGNPCLWSPGVRMGTPADGWFRQTECFGPVLGVVRARDLDEAIRIQNDSEFGLTGGIHTLDDREIERWLDRVEVGNAYVNRSITGAIVRRQPFGGWKKSAVGPGGKAGGPNYVQQLGVWREVDLPEWRLAPVEPVESCLALLEKELPEEVCMLRAAAGSDAYWWREEFAREHDPSALRGERNIFRYRPLERVVCRFGGGSVVAAARVLLAARCCGVEVELSSSVAMGPLGGVEVREESDAELAARLEGMAPGAVRVRALGASPQSRMAAQGRGIPFLDRPVLANGRIELLGYLREQSISECTHRYGNVIK